MVGSFEPKPEAMAGSETDRRSVTPAIAFGFGLNDYEKGRLPFLTFLALSIVEPQLEPNCILCL